MTLPESSSPQIHADPAAGRHTDPVPPSIRGAEAGAGRRRVLRVAGAAALAGAAGLISTRAVSQPRKITFAWNQAGFCLAPVPVALERGIFEKNGLNVDLLNWSGSSDQLLEAMSTGKAEVGVGLIHRWIKPLEAGFDVKVVGSVHGGCLRLIGVKDAGVSGDIASLKGKVIGVADLNSPAKQFYSIHLAKRGIDIDKEIEFRVYPADLLDVAVKKGEIQAIADGDPNLFLIERRNPGTFVEIANSAKGEYAERLCCIVGARGEFARAEKGHTAALVRSLVQAADYVAENPNEAARIYTKYAPKVSVEDLHTLLSELTYRHHPTGKPLRDEVEAFARDFHGAGILKKSTDPVRFANHVAVDVLS